ncbi:MAG: glutamate--tRNA ligase [Candidatus Krumholzibacteriota bacterium]|nr:glutamate--tRNA ligase [Candidatus Krumholzibacteriota bacterium]
MSDGIRVRFAPSPTGHLHVGGARTALYNWLYARKTGGAFILRIEDTDAARSSEESVRGILEGLRWLGLDWDEGPDVGGPHAPYFQSERRELYQAEAARLVAEGGAYPCFCAPEAVEAIREAERAAGRDPNYDGRCGRIPPGEAARRVAAGEPHVIRFRSPDEGETLLFDVIRGKMAFRNELLEDFVLVKGDGLPTYNFAVVVDDDAMGITHVIRGDDHISNSPRHVLLYQALGYKLPKFAHLPMILGADKTRLSKRHGATSVQEFEKQGILPAGMMNYLALLGWSLDGKTELFTPRKLVEAFSLKRVGSNPSVFDPDKLAWLSGEHFTRLSDDEKAAGIHAFLTGQGLALPPLDAIRPRLAALVGLMGKRIKSWPEAAERLGHFFRERPDYDPEAVAEHLGGEAAGRLADLAGRLAGVAPWEAGAIEAALRERAEAMGIEAAALIHPLRVAVTGRSVSPDIFSVCELLGSDLTRARLTGRGWEG